MLNNEEVVCNAPQILKRTLTFIGTYEEMIAYFAEQEEQEKAAAESYGDLSEPAPVDLSHQV